LKTLIKYFIKLHSFDIIKYLYEKKPYSYRFIADELFTVAKTSKLIGIEKYLVVENLDFINIKRCSFKDKDIIFTLFDKILKSKIEFKNKLRMLFYIIKNSRFKIDLENICKKLYAKLNDKHNYEISIKEIKIICKLLETQCNNENDCYWKKMEKILHGMDYFHFYPNNEKIYFDSSLYFDTFYNFIGKCYLRHSECREQFIDTINHLTKSDICRIYVRYEIQPYCHFFLSSFLQNCGRFDLDHYIRYINDSQDKIYTINRNKQSHHVLIFDINFDIEKRKINYDNYRLLYFIFFLMFIVSIYFSTLTWSSC
jgi:hypothetical protein